MDQRFPRANRFFYSINFKIQPAGLTLSVTSIAPLPALSRASRSPIRTNAEECRIAGTMVESAIAGQGQGIKTPIGAKLRAPTEPLPQYFSRSICYVSCVHITSLAFQKSQTPLMRNIGRSLEHRGRELDS